MERILRHENPAHSVKEIQSASQQTLGGQNRQIIHWIHWIWTMIQAPERCRGFAGLFKPAVYTHMSVLS